VKRGEIWWAEEPAGSPRPYLILTRDEAIGRLSRLLVVPATRTIRGIETEVEVGPEEGLSVECVLSLDNTTLIRKALLIERVGAIGAPKLAEVCRALGRATSCG
jgi:mRNA interferase MazF